MKKINKRLNIVNNVQGNDGSIMQQVIEGSAYYSMDNRITGTGAPTLNRVT